MRYFRFNYAFRIYENYWNDTANHFEQGEGLISMDEAKKNILDFYKGKFSENDIKVISRHEFNDEKEYLDYIHKPRVKMKIGVTKRDK